MIFFRSRRTVKLQLYIEMNLFLQSGSKKPSEGRRPEEEGAEKKDEKENQLKRTKSRELRGGIMYYSCHCIKRNGLQHDCRRTGCGGEPACLVLPYPLCAPSQLARARGLADPAPLAAHMRAQGGGSSSGAADSSSGGGKRFIVCELKGIIPDSSTNKGGNNCCKCPAKSVNSPLGHSGFGPQACVYSGNVAAPPTPIVKTIGVHRYGTSKCPCTCVSGAANVPTSIFPLDEKALNQIIKRFETKEMAPRIPKSGPGGHGAIKPVTKEEPCTRPGCVHWNPPPPCVWDAPCKADCFETPVDIRPGRNLLMGGGGASKSSGGYLGGKVSQGTQQPRERMKLLTPECCTGCSSGGHGQGSASAGPAGGLPLMVMKLC